MTRWAIALFLLACSIAAVGPPTRIVLLGNSITAGMVSGDGGTPYADLLPDLLGSGFAVPNVACGGTSSRDWTLSAGSAVCGALGAMPPSIFESRLAPELPADVVVILLGTNDAIGYGEPAPLTGPEYRAAMEELIGLIRERGGAAVVLMVPPFTYGVPMANLQIMAYRNEILGMCAELDSVFCGPNLTVTLGPDDFYDGEVHPNAQGHEKIAQALAGFILSMPMPAAATLRAVGPAALSAIALTLVAVGSFSSRALRRR